MPCENSQVNLVGGVGIVEVVTWWANALQDEDLPVLDAVPRPVAPLIERALPGSARSQCACVRRCIAAAAAARRVGG